MRTSDLGPFAAVAALALVGALVLDVPLGSLVVIAVLLACPVMMIFMMKGMHGGDRGESGQHDSDNRRHPHSRH